MLPRRIEHHARGLVGVRLMFLGPEVPHHVGRRSVDVFFSPEAYPDK